MENLSNPPDPRKRSGTNIPKINRPETLPPRPTHFGISYLIFRYRCYKVSTIRRLARNADFTDSQPMDRLLSLSLSLSPWLALPPSLARSAREIIPPCGVVQ
jgi:hypothetical protein